MALLSVLSRRRAAFTLVELLTVIGIIALLIGILVPSLARARDLAKKTKTAAELGAISTSLEVFRTEFKQYPESNSLRMDPLINMPNAPDLAVPRLTGAHWLARALAGPDGLGIDTQGLVLRDRQFVDVDPGSGRLISVQSGGKGGTVEALHKMDRKGSYLESSTVLARDNDASKFAKPDDTGRFVLVDAFNGPILYYRATPLARFPFGVCFGPGSPDTLPVYNLWDNVHITGCHTEVSHVWDFANTGLRHGLRYFGPSQPQLLTDPGLVETMIPPEELGYRGKSFTDFLHDRKVYTTGGVIKPVNPESFLLLSAGKDGLFGTDDDVANFEN